MKQEDKELLLKDLCGRLSYGVMCLADIDKTFDGGVISKINVINLKKDWLEFENIITPFHLYEVKPYLRPMSSVASLISAKEWSSLGGIELIDWYNANHIDYRGLIERGLAIEVNESNNPYNE